MSESVRRSSMPMPASVLSYFVDKSTKMATDLLLAKKRPSVPEDIAWNELRAFYQANLAAKQIEVEHAIFLEELWKEVCEPMGVPWTIYGPHHQKEINAVDLRTIWDESWFLREFFKGQYSCEIAIYVGQDEGIQVGFGLWHEEDSLLRSTPSGEWEEPDDILWSPEGAVPVAAQIDLQKLRELAKEGRTFTLNTLEKHEARS
ncbi:MAG: hypothetical protein WA954_00880 [Parerythrobacter sp.]